MKNCKSNADGTLTDHEWQKFKKTIYPDQVTDKRYLVGTGKRGGPYKGPNSWYLVIQACVRCKLKKALDLREGK